MTNHLCEGMERGAPSLRFWSTMHDVDDRPSSRAPSAKVSHEALSALRGRLSPTMACRPQRIVVATRETPLIALACARAEMRRGFLHRHAFIPFSNVPFGIGVARPALA